MARPPEKLWEYVPLKNEKDPRFKTDWPLYSYHSMSSNVIGTVPRYQHFHVMDFKGPWVHARLPNGLVGWVLTTHRGKRVLHVADRPKSYGWQRARGHAKNYPTIIEKRTEQLRQIDLAANPALLVEWYELVKERDAIFKFGFRSKLNRPACQKNERRKRAHSFLDLFKTTSVGATSDGDAAPARRPRASSFSAFLAAKRASGSTYASTHTDDATAQAAANLREQKRRLEAQERQTAQAVIKATIGDFNDGVPAGMSDGDVTVEARLRSDPILMARLAIEAEQRLKGESAASAPAPVSPPQGLYEVTHDTPSTALSAPPPLDTADRGDCSDLDPYAIGDLGSNLGSDLGATEHETRVELLSPSSVVSAEEMTLADIEQIVQGSGTYGSDQTQPLDETTTTTNVSPDVSLNGAPRSPPPPVEAAVPSPVAQVEQPTPAAVTPAAATPSPTAIMPAEAESEVMTPTPVEAVAVVPVVEIVELASPEDAMPPASAETSPVPPPEESPTQTETEREESAKKIEEKMAAQDEFLRQRQLKVAEGLARMREAFAKGARSKGHVAVLAQRGYSTAPVSAAGPVVRVDTLSPAEATARERAHAVLMQRDGRCGSVSTRPPTSDSILITF
mmetsp:Transcript_35798/g.93674  ORF Transcript_35798/g.93674 Transcript_35798/m.93674 type:complete len:621 (-) Transcript_35798:4-1866(-)